LPDPGYLQLLQLFALQLPQSPPPREEVNFPPLFMPKRENFFSTLRLRQLGQLTAAVEETIFSKSSPHLEQLNS
jgi:hypothetical protein